MDRCVNVCETFGKVIVDQLAQLGVTDFVLAPGLRSTPLAIAAAKDPRVNTHVHFDERGAGFFALGKARAAARPVAVIVTSATAVGNLMPPVMEAAAAEVPLILLTCDRPHELRQTGANQVADQIKIFGDFVRFHFDFPRPSASLPPRFLATTIAEGVYRAQFPLPGPVQFNFPFPEPFIGEQPPHPCKLEPVHLHMPKVVPTDTIDLGCKRGVIVVGRGGSSDAVSDLAKRLGWPIFADIASGHRERGDPAMIAYYHHILKAYSNLRTETVIQVGGIPVSKVLLHWMAKQPEIIHVSPSGRRIDPCHIVTRRTAACESIIGAEADGWIQQWKQWAKKARLEWKGLSEPAAIVSLHNCSDALFFANSMPIRDADMFFFPKEQRRPIFANRGLSGIDGNIATACGIASQMPVTAVLGDLTTLHDLNSLSLVAKTEYRLRLLILNNGGGGIFSFLPLGHHQELLDPYFAAAHTLDFAPFAKGFGLSYERVDTLERLQKSAATLIEIVTRRDENLRLHQEIDAQIQARLCSSFSTVS